MVEEEEEEEERDFRTVLASNSWHIICQLAAVDELFVILDVVAGGGCW